MTSNDIEISKTHKFLTAVVDRPSKDEYSAIRHYNWTIKYFHFCALPHGKGWIKPDKARQVIQLLCSVLNVSVPLVVTLEGSGPQAVTLPMDGMIVFRYSHYTVGIIAHEFSHWYLWHKYKLINSHNNPIMKRLEAQLNFLLVTHLLNTDYHEEYVNSLKHLGGEAGKIEQIEEEHETK